MAFEGINLDSITSVFTVGIPLLFAYVTGVYTFYQMFSHAKRRESEAQADFVPMRLPPDGVRLNMPYQYSAVAIGSALTGMCFYVGLIGLGDFLGTQAAFVVPPVVTCAAWAVYGLVSALTIAAIVSCRIKPPAIITAILGSIMGVVPPFVAFLQLRLSQGDPLGTPTLAVALFGTALLGIVAAICVLWHGVMVVTRKKLRAVVSGKCASDETALHGQEIEHEISQALYEYGAGPLVSGCSWVVSLVSAQAVSRKATLALWSSGATASLLLAVAGATFLLNLPGVVSVVEVDSSTNVRAVSAVNMFLRVVEKDEIDVYGHQVKHTDYCYDAIGVTSRIEKPSNELPSKYMRDVQPSEDVVNKCMDELSEEGLASCGVIDSQDRVLLTVRLKVQDGGAEE